MIERLHAGVVPCRPSCPVHPTCEGRLVPLHGQPPVSGREPRGECDACGARFGLEHEALEYLDHRAEQRERASSTPPGVA